MTIDELRKYLELDDIEFSYNGKDYFICPLNNIFSAGEADKTEAEYKTFDDLINNFMIEGKPLKDIITDIDW